MDATQVDEHFPHEFFSATSVSCWQMADDSLIAWPCKGLVQVDSLDTTLSTVGTMPSIPEDGIAARDWWFEDIPSHWSGMRSLWKQVLKLGTCSNTRDLVGPAGYLKIFTFIECIYRGGTAFAWTATQLMMEVFHQKRAISPSDIFPPVVFVKLPFCITSKSFILN